MKYQDWNKKYRYLSDEYNEMSFEQRCKVSRMIHAQEIVELIRAREAMKTEGTNYFNKRIKQIESGIKDSENRLKFIQEK